MTKTIQRGSLNPVIVIEEHEIAAWLREKVNEAGFADRELSAVQIMIEGKPYCMGYPELSVMVSNVPGSAREKPGASPAQPPQ